MREMCKLDVGWVEVGLDGWVFLDLIGGYHTISKKRKNWWLMTNEDLPQRKRMVIERYDEKSYHPIVSHDHLNK